MKHCGDNTQINTLLGKISINTLELWVNFDQIHCFWAYFGLIIDERLVQQDEFLKGRAHKSNRKGKSKDFISKS